MGKMKALWQAEREQGKHQDPEQYSMLDLCKLALTSGFKYESLRGLDVNDEPTDEFLLRIYSNEGDLTTRVTSSQLRQLGIEVLE